MKHQVSELDGKLLDAAVALADGRRDVEKWGAGLVIPGFGTGQPGSDVMTWSPSRNWQFGGPIIERERISVSYDDQGGRERGMWNAYAPNGAMHQSFDSTLIAAMRAYVASRFGDEVELP